MLAEKSKKYRKFIKILVKVHINRKRTIERKEIELTKNTKRAIIITIRTS